MTSRFRRAGNSGGGVPDGRSALICPSCGLRNDPSAKFCRNCGLPLGWPQDPVRGTTTRRADLPSERGAGVASIIGLLAAVAVLVVAGYLVLRGNSGGGTLLPTHSPTPHPSLAVVGPSAFPSGSPIVVPSGGASPSPVASETPTEPVATDTPGTLPTSTGFSCDTQSIADPGLGRWRVTHVTWSSSAGFDTVILDMTREGNADRPATVQVETMDLSAVSTTYGMTAPRNADRAVVVTFERRVNGFQVSPLRTNMAVVPNVAMGQGSDNLWHVVLGANGNGCQRIGVDAWGTDASAQTAQLLIDVKKS